MERRIEIPEGVHVNLENRKVIVKGSKGELSRSFSDPRFNKMVKIEKNGNEVVVSGDDKRKVKAFVGTVESHILNMIDGVVNGYQYKMKILYTHFPINIEIKGDSVLIRNFLGEKGARVAKITGKVDVKVQKDEIILTGINKEDAGQTAANIERACKISKRDRRIFVDGIFIQGWKVAE